MIRPVRTAVAALAASLALAATIAPGASAATEVGSNCVAEDLTMSPFIMVGEMDAGGLPVSVPAAGIATTWTGRVAAFGAEPTIEYMKVLRPVAPGQFRVVGESGSTLVGPGQGPFKTRIPVQAGDRIGIFGTEGVFYCLSGNPADMIWSLNRNLAIGSTATFAANAPGIQAAVSATIEPDSDNDGYGDETQDLCPQSPAWNEIPCPSLNLSFFSLAAKSAVFVYVSAGVASQITVSAQVTKKLKLKPLQHLANPGQITKYKLPLTGALRRKLAATRRTKTLGLKVTASGANAAGIVKSETRTLRLKGRG
ncbi:MAG TPA: hypothetical protein VIT85_08625 [Solirubrobacterales bacterium]